MGDTVAAPLSGRFTLTGRGTAPEEATVAARLELDELRYAARRIEQVIARARVERGRAVLDLRGSLQGGRLTVDASARPFDSVTAFAIRRAALDSVDLGTLLGRPDLAGPVTLEVRGSGRWSESAKAVRARVTVAPSRLGQVQVTHGIVDAELAGERLTYDAALQTTGGSLVLEGDGRPLDRVPSYVVRAGRADSLDLGTLLGRDSLRTDLGARFTGVAGRERNRQHARAARPRAAPLPGQPGGPWPRAAHARARPRRPGRHAAPGGRGRRGDGQAHR